jgi:hypothetical protein
MKQNKRLRLGFVGLVALAITIVSNLVAAFALKLVSAAYFSDKWWSDWFPIYFIWLSLATIGFATYRREKSGDTKADV